MSDIIKRLLSANAKIIAEKALRLGFPITCATCEHLKTAFENSSENCGKTLTCGGPIFQRSFPDYAGPLKTDDYEKVCLKCGSTNVAFYALGSIRRFGLCYKHRLIFDNIDRPGTPKPVVLSVTSLIHLESNKTTKT